MIQFKSIEEILHFALAKEQSSQQFYLDLSQAVSSPVAQGVFTALANEESRHIESVETELFKMGYTLRKETAQPRETEPSGRLTLDDEAKQMTFLDALRLAMEKERAAFRLFAELMAVTEEPEAREVLAELAEEEVRHLLRLEKEYESFTSSRHHAED